MQSVNDKKGRINVMFVYAYTGVKIVSIETDNIVTMTCNDDPPIMGDYNNLLVFECNLLYYINIETSITYELGMSHKLCKGVNIQSESCICKRMNMYNML